MKQSDNFYEIGEEISVKESAVEIKKVKQKK